MVFSLFKSKDNKKKQVDAGVAAALAGERSSNPQVFIKLAEHFMRENKRDLAVDEYLHAAQAFIEKRQTQLAMAVYRNIITIDPERYSVYETLADLYLKAGFPGDGASVLLALAYQYKTAGCGSEVKRVLDSVLEYSPNNPVLKRKVQAFLAGEGRPGNAPQKPSASAQPGASVVKQVSPPQLREHAAEPEVVIQTAAPAKKSVVPGQDADSAHRGAFGSGTQIAAQPDAVSQPEEPEAPERSFFDVQSALVSDGGPEQVGAVPAQPDEADSGPDICAEPDIVARPEEPEVSERSFFDVQSALVPDGAPEQVGAAAEQPVEPDETVRSFFDLQSALAMDVSLEFDHDVSSESLLNAEEERAPFSVLDVVKDIAEQDPRQDTPLFHFNLGVAYMKCADYEQAVDEFLSALYGTSDKIGCYVRLAECSLKLHRRELASGFLREALDHQELSPEQERDVRKRLDEISAG